MWLWEQLYLSLIHIFEACEFALNADSDGFEVIIAAAGKAAHLAGVIAANTPLPVIGIPIKTSFAGGLDSLLSVVQMPKGVPVATVAVDGSENAAILAAQILSVKYPHIKDTILEYKEQIHDEVLSSNNKIKGE